MILLTEHKRTQIERQFGAAGQRWIADFPALLAACCNRWHLEVVGVAAAGLPINVVLLVTGEAGEPLVLKLGYPHPEQLTEMIALAQYQGRRVPRMIDSDVAGRALLMERVSPGTTYRETGPGTALPLDLFADLVVEMPDGTRLPQFSEWIRRAFEAFRQRPESDPRLASHLDLAATLFDELAADADQDYLLHGDLHHENILLDARRGWLAIDPKGVLGPRVLQCGRFVHNFIEHGSGDASGTKATSADITAVMQVRAQALAGAMGEPVTAVTRAAYIDLVLGTVWTSNDGGDVVMDKLEAARRLKF